MEAKIEIWKNQWNSKYWEGKNWNEWQNSSWKCVLSVLNLNWEMQHTLQCIKKYTDMTGIKEKVSVSVSWFMWLHMPLPLMLPTETSSWFCQSNKAEEPPQAKLSMTGHSRSIPASKNRARSGSRNWLSNYSSQDIFLPFDHFCVGHYSWIVREKPSFPWRFRKNSHKNLATDYGPLTYNELWQSTMTIKTTMQAWRRILFHSAVNILHSLCNIKS